MGYVSKLQFARIAPTKVHHVLDLVRGKSVEAGLDALRFIPNRSARMVEKLIKSARANAEDRGERNVGALYVTTAMAGSGPTLKRIQPHARGMGFMIKKRFTHITIELDVRNAWGCTIWCEECRWAAPGPV
jgi:large subunit ribosomal protein L22